MVEYTLLTPILMYRLSNVYLSYIYRVSIVYLTYIYRNLRRRDSIR